MPDPATCDYGSAPIIRARMLHVSGTSPSQIWLTTLRQDVPISGTVSFRQGGTLIQFRDCALKSSHTVNTEHGTFWRHVVEDRRWRWRGIGVDGAYNQQYPSGQPRREIDARALMARLLDAVGEVGYSISGVPDTLYPSISWTDTPATVAMERLARRVGCRICLNLDNTVSVVTKQASVNVSETFAKWQVIPSPARPRYITLRLRPTIFRTRLLLEPIVFFGGSTGVQYQQQSPADVRPLRTSLNAITNIVVSPGRWEICPLMDTTSLAAVPDFAFRWFRVATSHPEVPGYSISLPNYPNVIISESSQIELLPQAYTGMPPNIVGYYTDLRNPAMNQWYDKTLQLTTRPAHEQSGAVQVQKDQVFTDWPVFRLTTDGYVREPLVCIEAGLRVRDESGQLVRREYTLDLGGVGEATHFIYDDMFHVSVGAFAISSTDNSNFSSAANYSNSTEIDPLADAYMTRERDAMVGSSYDVGYVILAPIDLGPTIAQVEWSCGVRERGVTRVGVGAEFDEVYPSPLWRQIEDQQKWDARL